jgi:large subunit ribosomal protein L3
MIIPSIEMRLNDISRIGINRREPGSIGGGLRNKVPKKMRMAGRMGSDRVTVKNLKVLHVDSATNTLYISGAVPGRRGTLIEIIS